MPALLTNTSSTGSAAIASRISADFVTSQTTACARGDLRRSRLDLIARPCGEPHFRPGFGERHRARAPDAASGTGDEGRAAIEAEIHLAGVVSFRAPRPTFWPP